MKEMSSWITVADWMLDLGLDAREMMIFALVYGVCSHNDRYYGTREHTAKWARCTADTAGKILNALAEKGFLLKQEEMLHGSIKRCYYTIARESVKKKREAAEAADGDEGSGEPAPEKAEKPVEKPVDKPAATGEKIAGTGEKIAGGYAKIAPATGAKIADYINRSTDLKNKDKRQEDFVFSDSPEGEKKAENREDATAVFNGARKLWNELGLKPECRDLVIPPSEYDCLRTFQHYSFKDILNAIRNFDWHVKGRCGKGFRPPPPYGSLYGFLKSGVPRYFDDDAIDQQFRVPGYGA